MITNFTDWDTRREGHLQYFESIASEDGPEAYMSGIALSFLSDWTKCVGRDDPAEVTRLYRDLSHDLTQGQLDEATGWIMLKADVNAWLVHRFDALGWPGREAAFAIADVFQHHFEGLSGEMSEPGADIARRWAILEREQAPHAARTALHREATTAPFAKTLGWYLFPELIEAWAPPTPQKPI